jgi:DNA primase
VDAMPGIDFRALRTLVTISDVLALTEFRPVIRRGFQVRGPCPIHGSKTPQSRSFSVHLQMNTFRCFTCGCGGNQLDLWIAVSKLTLAEASTDLCDRLKIEVPYLRQK